ncbi:hypothetical protein MR511_04140 [bacterium]|nr:hypothetical protein [bacterium]
MAKEKPIFNDVQELFDKLEPTYGHTFREYDINHRLDNPDNKGQLGHIVEEGILGYPINSNPEADIANLGIEIKVTGIIQNENGSIKAKERLAIDAINYESVIGSAFESSLMWAKAKKMLFVFYRYLEGKPYGDMPIIKAVLNEFDPIDIAIIKRDYEYIQQMIEAGRAEDISEGDTMFLGACTAGTGALVAQPFSDTKAKQRKFCLKQSYFSQLVRKYVSGEEYEHVLNIEEAKKATFEMTMEANLRPYYGMSEQAIRINFGIKDNPEAKNRYERYLAAMLGIKGVVSDSDEFQKAGIKIKTIRVKENGKIKESMSFPYFEFTDIYFQDWSNSDIRNMFATTKYMFVVFVERKDGLFFDHIQFWHMTEYELENYVRPVYEKLKNIIETGNIVASITKNADGKTIRRTNFPGMSDNPLIHVRPHARDANDTCDLPVKDRLTGASTFTKQCFWLNSSFVAKIIKTQNK